MNEIIMTEQTLYETIESIKEFDTKNELPTVLEAATLPEKWARLITSSVFKENVGEWEKVDGICLYVNE